MKSHKRCESLSDLIILEQLASHLELSFLIGEGLREEVDGPLSYIPSVMPASPPANAIHDTHYT